MEDKEREMDVDVNDVPVRNKKATSKPAGNKTGNAQEQQQDVVDAANIKEFGLKGYCTLTLPFCSLIFFLLDFGTDIALLLEYKMKGEHIFFYLTLAFLVIPSLIAVFVDLSWLYLDQKPVTPNDSTQPQKPDPFRLIKGFARFVLGILSLGIAVRIVQHMYYKYKKRTSTDTLWKDYYREQVRMTKRDCVFLGFIFAFSETYSQAALQLYIFMKNPVSLVSRIGFSIVTSVFFMPLAYADHYRYNRLQGTEGINKTDMHCIVFIFYFLGVLGGMTFRIVSIAMFIAAVPLEISIPIVNLHFLFVFFWLLFYHKPSFRGMLITENPVLVKVGKILYTVLYGVANMLFFVDLYERDGVKSSPKWRMIGYNAILYVESAVFIAFGFVWANVEVISYSMVLLVGFLLHLVFIANYYQFLHPNIGICYNCIEAEPPAANRAVRGDDAEQHPHEVVPLKPANNPEQIVEIEMKELSENGLQELTADGNQKLVADGN